MSHAEFWSAARVIPLIPSLPGHDLCGKRSGFGHASPQQLHRRRSAVERDLFGQVGLAQRRAEAYQNLSRSRSLDERVSRLFYVHGCVFRVLLIRCHSDGFRWAGTYGHAGKQHTRLTETAPVFRYS